MAVEIEPPLADRAHLFVRADPRTDWPPGRLTNGQAAFDPLCHRSSEYNLECLRSASRNVVSHGDCHRSGDGDVHSLGNHPLCSLRSTVWCWCGRSKTTIKRRWIGWRVYHTIPAASANSADRAQAAPPNPSRLPPRAPEGVRHSSVAASWDSICGLLQPQQFSVADYPSTTCNTSFSRVPNPLSRPGGQMYGV